MHLFNSPNRVVFLLVPYKARVTTKNENTKGMKCLTMLPGASVKFKARSALASSRIYWARSWVRMLHAPWFDGSDRSDK